MPIRDSRVLEFDGEALRAAIMRCGKNMAPSGVCAENIDRLDFLPERQELVVWFSAGDRLQSCTWTADRICALVVAYCAAIRLPMPHGAAKRIEVGQNIVRMAMSHLVADPKAHGGSKPMHPLTAQGRAVAWD